MGYPVFIDTVLQEVQGERDRQVAKGYNSRYDNENKIFESFVRDIESYNMWARQMYDMGSPDKARRRMIQVAALAAAAVEWIDRNANVEKGV